MSDVVTQEKSDDPLAQARQFLEDGLFEECLSHLKPYWLTKPDDASATRMFGTLMTESGRSELARKLKALADLMEAKEPDLSEEGKQAFTYALFEAGFSLIDVREHELALMLLNKCLAESPEDPTVNYEIAFSLMSLGRFEEAIKHFKCTAQDKEDFDTVLNLLVCYTLTRKIAEAKPLLETLAQLAQDEEEQRELSHRKTVLTRLESLAKKTTLSTRDWLYILYGGVLLQDDSYQDGKPKPDEKPKTAEKPKPDDHKEIAAMLLIAKGFLEGLRIEYEAIEYYNTTARPLARVLAELMEVPCNSYMGPDRPDRALLLLTWAPEIIGPHGAFVEHLQTRSIFAYGLNWDEPLPVAPEICGKLAHMAPVPWVETTKEHSEDKIFQSILDRARTLESDPDILRRIQEAVQYYESKQPLLVLNNDGVFPSRPEYTAEIFPA